MLTSKAQACVIVSQGPKGLRYGGHIGISLPVSNNSPLPQTARHRWKSPTVPKALWQEAWPRGEENCAVNIAVVAVEVAEVLCGEWLLSVCVFGHTRMCKSIRAGAGRWDPCDSQPGLGVSWILCVAI